MSYVKILPEHAGDDRWIEAGPDAFMVHAWALVHCNTQLSEGRINKAMALRLTLPVPLERTQPAIDRLVALGFWLDEGTAYLIVDFHSHALSAEEIKATRKRWADDKRRRRQHDNGNHGDCNPSRCKGAMSAVDSDRESEVESDTESRRKTRPDRPDQTYGSGSGVEHEPGPADAGQHVLGLGHQFRAPIDEPDTCAICQRTRDEHDGETAA